MKFENNLSSCLELVPDFISSMIEKLFYLPLDENTIFKIRLTLQEAVVNAVKHGNKQNEELNVHVAVHVEENRVITEVTDQGEGFDDQSLPDPTLPDNITRLEGRGVFLIRNLVDNVQFLDGGRTIRMTILLKKERRGRVEIKVDKENDVMIVTLDGEITVKNSTQLRDAFTKISGEGALKVVVDFERVIFIDSSALATIVEMHQRIRKAGGELRLCYVSKNVRGIFEITKIHKLINIYDSRDTALKDF